MLKPHVQATGRGYVCMTIKGEPLESSACHTGTKADCLAVAKRLNKSALKGIKWIFVEYVD